MNTGIVIGIKSLTILEDWLKIISELIICIKLKNKINSLDEFIYYFERSNQELQGCWC